MDGGTGFRADLNRYVIAELCIKSRRHLCSPSFVRFCHVHQISCSKGSNSFTESKIQDSFPSTGIQHVLHSSNCGVARAVALYFYSVFESAYGGSHIVCWVSALFVPTQFVPFLVHPT